MCSEENCLARTSSLDNEAPSMTLAAANEEIKQAARDKHLTPKEFEKYFHGEAQGLEADTPSDHRLIDTAAGSTVRQTVVSGTGLISCVLRRDTV